MRFKPMTKRATWLTPHNLEIEITHHIAQSYSRGVDPVASRFAKQNLSGGSWELHDVQYGRPGPDDQSCVSVYSYRRELSS